MGAKAAPNLLCNHTDAASGATSDDNHPRDWRELYVITLTSLLSYDL